MSQLESKLIGEENKERGTILFSNSLGTHWSMWERQVDFFKNKFQIILYNTRAKKNTSIEQLGEDVVELVKGYGLEKVHFCGISLGGLIGQWLAIYRPEFFESITIANSAAKICDESIWDKRIELVEKEGFSPLKLSSPGIWFSREYNDKHVNEVGQVISGFDKIKVEDYLNSCTVLRDTDLREEIKNIKLPFNIIAGTKDRVTTVKDACFIRDGVSGAKLKELESSHISNIEAFKDFNLALEEFIVDNASN